MKYISGSEGQEKGKSQACHRSIFASIFFFPFFFVPFSSSSFFLESCGRLAPQRGPGVRPHVEGISRFRGISFSFSDFFFFFFFNIFFPPIFLRPEKKSHCQPLLFGVAFLSSFLRVVFLFCRVLLFFFKRARENGLLGRLSPVKPGKTR